MAAAWKHAVLSLQEPLAAVAVEIPDLDRSCDYPPIGSLEDGEIAFRPMAF